MALRPSTGVGFSAGVKYWIFFLLALTIAGYQPFLSITLGAIGGLAAGVIAAWSKPEQYISAAQVEEATKAVAPPSPEPFAIERIRFRRYGGSSIRKHRELRAIRHFGWLFRRKK